MAVAFRSASNTGADQTVSALQLPVPAGATDRDVVVCVVSRWATFAHPALVVPTDFLPFGVEAATPDGNGRLLCFYKRLAAPESGTYDFSWGSAMLAHIHAQCFSGVAKTGDPVGASFTTASSATSSPLPGASLTVTFPPALVWSCFITTFSSAIGQPTGGFTETADTGNGSTAYRVPGSTGTFLASNGGATPASPSCVVYFALAPVPPAALDGSGSAAAGAEADLTVSGTHVLLAGDAQAASQAQGTLSGPVPLAGVVELAGHAAGDLTFLVGPLELDATGSAAADATAELDRQAGLAGVVELAAGLVGDLDVTAAPIELDGTAEAASAAGAELDRQVELAGQLAVAGEADAALLVQAEHGLDGAVDSASGAEGALGLELGLAGQIAHASAATGELGEDTGLAGSLDVAAWAGATLVYAVGRDTSVHLGFRRYHAVVATEAPRAVLGPDPRWHAELEAP